MIRLVPLPEALYAAFLEAAVEDYAAENVASGRWRREDALATSRAEHGRLLPEGLATPDQHLMELHDAATDELVGHLWVALADRAGVRSAYVYLVQVLPAFRRRGHARAAFQALEPFVASLGATSIGLHVFTQNAAAQALYRSLGYGVTGFNMVKALGAA